MTAATLPPDHNRQPVRAETYRNSLTFSLRGGSSAPAMGDAFAEVFQLMAGTQSPEPASHAEEPRPEETRPSEDSPVTASSESSHSESTTQVENGTSSDTIAEPLAVVTSDGDADEADENLSGEETAPDQPAPSAVSRETPVLAQHTAERTAEDTKSNTEEANVPLPGTEFQQGQSNPESAAQENAAQAAGTETGQRVTTTKSNAATNAIADAAGPTPVNSESESIATDTSQESADEKQPVARYAGETEDPADASPRQSKRRGDPLSKQQSRSTADLEADRGATQSQTPPATQVTATAAAKPVTADTHPDSIANLETALPTAPPANATIPPAVVAAQTAVRQTTVVTQTVAATKESAAPVKSGDATASTPGTAVGREAGSTKNAANGKDTVEGPRVADRALLVQRVSRAFQRLGVDGGRVRIRLHPEELGGVQLQLSVQGQRMSARVVAETEAARTSVLNEHLPELRQRLIDQGMKVDRLEVQLEGHQDASENWDSFAGQGRAGQGRDQRRSTPRDRQGGPELDRLESANRSNGNRPASLRTVVEAAQQKSMDLLG